MDTPVGIVQEVIFISMNAMGERSETNISKGFEVNAEATYGQFDEAMRSLSNLTANTYNDTNLITSISVNEKASD